MFSFSQRVRQANQRELETYAKKHAQMEGRIKETNDDIARLRQELVEARVERRHKEEYDLLARKILELPSRQESMAAMTTLKSDISTLEAEEKELSEKQDHRKKQFTLLLHLISDLENTLKAEAPEAATSPSALESVAEIAAGVGAGAAGTTSEDNGGKRKASDVPGDVAAPKKEKKQ